MINIIKQVMKNFKHLNPDAKAILVLPLLFIFLFLLAACL